MKNKELNLITLASIALSVYTIAGVYSRKIQRKKEAEIKAEQEWRRIEEFNKETLEMQERRLKDNP